MFWMQLPSQRIFGEASEKNLYLSQLIILDTLEKCLAGVSFCPPKLPDRIISYNQTLFKLTVQNDQVYLKTTDPQLHDKTLWRLQFVTSRPCALLWNIFTALFVFSKTQTTGNVLILHQSQCPALLEVPLRSSRPQLHLQAFGGRGTTSESCS